MPSSDTQFKQGHLSWKKGTGASLEGEAICSICGSIFHWKRAAYNPAPKTCSKKCRYVSASLAQKGVARIQSFPGERKYKRKAQRAVQRLVKQGVLKRLPCEECGDPHSEAHHFIGYDPQNWLDIRWLCSKHHHEAHEKLKKLL